MWLALATALGCNTPPTPDVTEDSDPDSKEVEESDVGDSPADSEVESGGDSEAPDSEPADSAPDSSPDSDAHTGGDSGGGPSGAFLGSVQVETVATFETHGGVDNGRIGSIDNLALSDDLSGDGQADLVLGSPFHDPGSVFVLGPGSTWGGDVESDALAVIEGNSQLGFLPLEMGDATGDGAHDLVVGDRATDSAGAAYIFEGPLSGTSTVADAWMTVEGSWSGAQWAEALDIGDVDGDGAAELVVGGAAPSGGAGVLSVFQASAGYFSGLDGLVASGDVAGDGFGATVVLGDLDGDGYEDALVGVPGRDDAAADAGAVVVLPGGSGGLGSASWTFLGPASAAARAGTNSRGVAPPQDLDGSGDADLALAAYGLGQVAVFSDPSPGLYAWSDAASTLVEPKTGAGSSLATADLDGDGDQDLLVGCYDDATYAASGGSALFFATLPTGTFARGSATAELWTPAAEQYLGTAVAGRPGEWFVVASWRSERVSRGGTLSAIAPW